MNVEVMVGREQLPKLMIPAWFADQVALWVRAKDDHNVTVLVVDGNAIAIEHEGEPAGAGDEQVLDNIVLAAVKDVLEREDYPKAGDF